MTIEFQTMHGDVPEKLISFIRNELINLSDLNKEISRAEIILKEDNSFIPSENKICEIRITAYGDNVSAYSRTETFEKSAGKVIKQLRRLVKQQLKKQKEPPDERTSTVKV